MIRIGVVDNDPLALQYLCVLLQRSRPDLRIAWQAGNGRRAIDLALDPQSSDVDALLVDASMEDIPGAAVCREIRQHSCRFPILGMTAFSLKSYAEAFAQAGAQGLVAKTDLASVCDALTTVLHDGRMPRSASTGDVPFEDAATSHMRLSACRNDCAGLLTARESQTVELCAQGLGLADVAQCMSVSVETVKTNLRRAEKRIGATNKDQLIAAWWRSR